MKLQSPKSLLSALFIALAVLASAQKPGPTASDESGAALGGTPQIVTHHFVRMHHPEFLIALAKQVAGGSAAKGDLLNLAGASFTETLLKSNLNALPAPHKLGASGPAEKLDRRGIFKLLNLPTTLGTSDYSPSSISYPSMIPGEEETRSVNITSPLDGTVTASVSKLPNDFHILLMESYSGLGQNGPDGASEVVDQSSTNGSIPIAAGQKFSLVMQVGSAVSGTFTADLNVNCNGPDGAWTVKIPLKIVVSDGNNYRAEYEGYNPQVLAFPGRAFNVKVKVNPINYRGPFNATLTTNGYGGLSAQPVNIHFDSNAPIMVTIPCMCAANATIQDNAIMGTIIQADNKESTLFWTQVDVTPFQLKVDYGTYGSNYSVSGYQTFGSVGSYQMKWTNATVVFDGAGNYTCLGTISDQNGWHCIAEDWKVSDSPAPFGVYMADYQGHFHGSYNQTHGRTQFIVTMWDDFVKGRIKSGVWFEPAHMTKYFDSHLPPIDKNGNFTAFEGHDIPIHHW